MKINNKRLKLVLFFIVILIVLCIGKNVKAIASIDFSVEHEAPMEPIDCSQPGDAGYFFCKNEFTPWNFYSKNLARISIQSAEFFYENAGEIKLEPTISFGLYTMQQLGYDIGSDLTTVQHLIWGSVKYSRETCEGGDPSKYEGGSLAIQRADQYGKFYYGVIGGGSSDLELAVTGIEDAKVFIDQKEPSAIIGPYYLSLVCHDVAGIGTEVAEENLRQELANKDLGDIPPFATCEINTAGASETIFLNQDGEEVNFPNFNEKFYLKCLVEGEPTELHPKLKITYVKSIRCSAFHDTSLENYTRVPSYVVMDEWYDNLGVDDARLNDGSASQAMLDVINSGITVRWYWISKCTRSCMD